MPFLSHRAIILSFLSIIFFPYAIYLYYKLLSPPWQKPSFIILNYFSTWPTVSCSSTIFTAFNILITDIWETSNSHLLALLSNNCFLSTSTIHKHGYILDFITTWHYLFSSLWPKSFYVILNLSQLYTILSLCPNQHPQIFTPFSSSTSFIHSNLQMTSSQLFTPESAPLNTSL